MSSLIFQSRFCGGLATGNGNVLLYLYVYRFYIANTLFLKHTETSFRMYGMRILSSNILQYRTTIWI